MVIRNLRSGDKKALSSLIKEIYVERPSAMWFEKSPDDDTIQGLVDYKIKGIGEGRIVDMVAEEGRSIVGECEIVNMPGGVGYVGILVRQEFRMQGIGKSLLASAIGEAKALGTRRLIADITENNTDAASFFAMNGFKRKFRERRTVSINGSAYGVITLEKTLNQ